MGGGALELLGAGGWVLGVLVIVSVLSLTVVVAKLVQFATSGLGRGRFVEPVLAALAGGRVGEARSLLAGERGPVARLLDFVAAPPEGLHGEGLAAEAQRRAQLEMRGVRSWFRALETAATLGPLLGLLGTVLGMIEAFQQMQLGAGQADASLLAGGIAKALLTTAGGLVVAIPATAALAWLESRADAVQAGIEDALARALRSSTVPDGDAAVARP